MAKSILEGFLDCKGEKGRKQGGSLILFFWFCWLLLYLSHPFNSFHAFYFDESCVSLPRGICWYQPCGLKKKAIQKRAGSLRFAPGRSMPAMCLSDGYDSGAIAVALGKLGIQPAMYTVQAREVAKQHSNPPNLLVLTCDSFTQNISLP